MATLALAPFVAPLAGTTFFILIGAFVLTPFVTLSGIPDALLGVIAESGAV